MSRGLPISYELLVSIVVINCAVTLCLWAVLRNIALFKADTPPRRVLNETIAKEFWDSKPISPPSQPPDAAGTIKSLSGAANPNLREFFQDFEQFVQVANHLLAEDYKIVNFRFRLKDLPHTEDNNRMPIRRFQIFYNRTAVGELDISPSYYDRVSYRVWSSFHIRSPRWIEYDELAGFIDIMSSWVTGSTRSEYEQGLSKRNGGLLSEVSEKLREKVREQRRTIELAMLKTLWSNYTYSGINLYIRGQNYFGQLEVRLDGSAYGYIETRDKINSREPPPPTPHPWGKPPPPKPDPRFNDRGPFRRDN